MPYLPGEWDARARSKDSDDSGYLFRDDDGLALVVQEGWPLGRVEVSVRWPGESWKWRVEPLRCTFAADRALKAVAAHVTRSLLTEETAQHLRELRANIAEAEEQDRQEQLNIERLGHQGHQLYDGRLLLTLPEPMMGRAWCGAQYADLELHRLSIDQAEAVLRLLRSA